MRAGTVLLVCTLAACGSRGPTRVPNDTVLGIHVGMTRRQLAKAFMPKGEGKWYEVESVVGEGRLRWAGTAEGTTPVALDIGLEHGQVAELVFTLRPDDARAALGAMGAPAKIAGLTELAGPSGSAVVSPGLGVWTLRLRQKAVGQAGH